MLTNPLARLVPVVLLGALLVLVAPTAPAAAAVVLLTNGDMLYGDLDGGLTVATDAGSVAVDARDLTEIQLGTLSGDLLHYRNGTSLTGVVAQPSYSLRLPSGQTLVVERDRVSVIRFGRR